MAIGRADRMATGPRIRPTAGLPCPLILLGLLALSPSPRAEAGFGYRKKITIQHTQVSGSGNLTDFPVLISISGDTQLKTTPTGHVTDAQGDDIIFRDSGNTRLDHEVEKYDGSAGNLIAWVRIPTLYGSTNTEIYMYYGNSAITTSQEDVDGVWDSYYVGVWHLDEGGTGTRYDSSGTGNNGSPTNYDGDEATSSGKIDGADDFDASNDYISVAHHASLAPTSKITVECWAKSDDSISQYDALVLKTQDTSYNYGYGFQFNNSTTMYFHVNGFWDDAATASVTASNWNHYVGTYDGSNVRIFVNGSEGTANPYTGSIDTTTNDLQIGRARIDTKCFPGIIDEVRVSNTNRSSDWIITCYNNQSNPSGFYTVDTESAVSCTGKFGFRKAITIDADYVSGTSGSLTDFPVLINITSSTDLESKPNGGDVENGNGYDIIFRDSDGVQLDHEIEKYTATTGELVAWVRISTLSKATDTVIYMYYGNCEIDSSLEDVTGVWDTNHKGVWHLAEEQASTGNADLYEDSTSNNNDGDDYISATGQDGKIANGHQLDGNDDYVNCGSGSSLNITGSITISLWFKTDSTGSPHIFQKYDLNSPYTGFGVRLVSGVLNLWSSGIGSWTQSNTTGLNNNVWHHVAVIGDGTSGKFYIDGNLDTNTFTYTAPASHSSEVLYIGALEGTSYPFPGYLDEIRVSNTGRSEDWVKTCYNNQSSSGTFYSIGTEEASAPSAVTLVSFAATPGDESVLITWEIASAFDNLGFNLWRAQRIDGPFARVNDRMIPGPGFSFAGGSFEYADLDVHPGAVYFYRLEEVDVYGVPTYYGPLRFTWDDPPRRSRAGSEFVRGDANGDGRVDIADMVFGLRYRLAQTPAPVCLKAADINADGIVDLADPVMGLRYLFAAGSPPLLPFPGCGPEEPASDLSCETFPACDGAPE